MTEFTIEYSGECLKCASQGFNAGLARGIILGVVAAVIIMSLIITMRRMTPTEPKEKKPDLITRWLKTRREKKMELPKIKFEFQKEPVNEPEKVQETTNIQMPNNVEQVPVIAPKPAKKGEIFCTRCGIKLKSGFFKKIIYYENGASCEDCHWVRQKELNKK